MIGIMIGVIAALLVYAGSRKVVPGDWDDSQQPRLH